MNSVTQRVSARFFRPYLCGIFSREEIASGLSVSGLQAVEPARIIFDDLACE
jgi:hypothetical protein